MIQDPPNPNPSLPSRHTIVLGTTGAGKSQMVKNIPDMPLTGVRLIGWDRAGDHAGAHYKDKAKFLQALKLAGNRSHFRIFWSGPASPDEMEWFCKVVWAMLDGKKLLYALVEELSPLSRSSGKADPMAAMLLNEGRKYGLIFIGTSQKPQEVSKTFIDSANMMYIGQQKATQVGRIARLIGVHDDEVRKLQPLQFLRDDGSANPPQLIQAKYKPMAANAVRWA